MTEKNNKTTNPGLIIFILTTLIMIFLLGGLFASKNWQPFAFIKSSFKDTQVLVEEIQQQRPALLLKKN